LSRNKIPIESDQDFTCDAPFHFVEHRSEINCRDFWRHEMGKDLTHPVALRSLKDSGSNASQPPRLFGAGLLNTSSLDFFVSENEFTTERNTDRQFTDSCHHSYKEKTANGREFTRMKIEKFAFIGVHSRFLLLEARLFQKAGLLGEWTRMKQKGTVFIRVHSWLIFLIHSPKSSSFSQSFFVSFVFFVVND